MRPLCAVTVLPVMQQRARSRLRPFGKLRRTVGSFEPRRLRSGEGMLLQLHSRYVASRHRATGCTEVARSAGRATQAASASERGAAGAVCGQCGERTRTACCNDARIGTRVKGCGAPPGLREVSPRDSSVGVVTVVIAHISGANQKISIFESNNLNLLDKSISFLASKRRRSLCSLTRVFKRGKLEPYIRTILEGICG